MGREFELKYTATDTVLSQLAALYPQRRQIQMETSYFDTADGALSAKKMTLRLRRENGSCICTLKTPLPDGSRGEWECAATSIGDGIRGLLSVGAPEQLGRWNETVLQIVCSARFIRQAITVPTADGTAELALDSGVLIGGGKEIPLHEVEVELKSGSEAATIDFAHQLCNTYGLTPQPLSKFQRALALAKENDHG